MNRLVCLGWISKPERKENFSSETRIAPLRTQPKLQPRFLTLSQMRLSHNGNLELILRAQRNASHRGGRLRSRLFANIGIWISLTNLTFELIPTTAAAARELDIEFGGRNNVGEIDCHSNVAAWVRSSDDAVILVNELPKRQD